MSITDIEFYFYVKYHVILVRSIQLRNWRVSNFLLDWKERERAFFYELYEYGCKKM